MMFDSSIEASRASSNKDLLVYILDLPSKIPENDLEQMIKTRVETTQRITLSDVQCYIKLSIAVI
jgi:hypothetical protein